LGLFLDFSVFYIVLFVSLGQINNLPSDPLESVHDSRTTPAADESRMQMGAQAKDKREEASCEKDVLEIKHYDGIKIGSRVSTRLIVNA